MKKNLVLQSASGSSKSDDVVIEKPDSIVNELLDKELGEPVHIATPLIGTLIDLNTKGEATITHPYAADKEFIAVTTVKLTSQDIGRDVVLLFNGGQANQPIITGIIQSPAAPHEPLVIDNPTGIEFKSGRAKIEMNSEGHIFITGVTIQNQASSAIRVNGASVKIN